LLKTFEGIPLRDGKMCSPKNWGMKSKSSTFIEEDIEAIRESRTKSETLCEEMDVTVSIVRNLEN
jgi:hypothetical protein